MELRLVKGNEYIYYGLYIIYCCITYSVFVWSPFWLIRTDIILLNKNLNSDPVESGSGSWNYNIYYSQASMKVFLDLWKKPPDLQRIHPELSCCFLGVRILGSADFIDSGSAVRFPRCQIELQGGGGVVITFNIVIFFKICAQGCGSGSALIWVAGSGSRRAKITHKYRKK